MNFLLMLGLAVLIWLFVQQEIVDTSEIEFKVYFQMPDNPRLLVMSYSAAGLHNPDKMKLKLRGSKSKLTELLFGETKELRIPVRVDERAIPRDGPLKLPVLITDDMLHLPANVTLVDSVTVDVFVDVLDTQDCKVKLNYDEGSLTGLPSSTQVTVTGPRSVVNGLEVLTERIDSATLRTLKDKELPLLNRVSDYRAGTRPDIMLRIDPPTVRVTAQEQRVPVTIPNVPIKVLGPPDFLKQYTVLIQGAWTRKLVFMVPPGSEERAKNESNLELILDVTSFVKDHKAPGTPVTLELRNRPDWMKLAEGEEDKDGINKNSMEVTIQDFEQIVK